MLFGQECIKYKGKWGLYDLRRPKFCRGKPCLMLRILKKSVPKIKKEFEGLPPSVFVGRYNYPNVNIGVLSPPEIMSDSWKYDAPGYWYQHRFGVFEILKMRYALVHSRDRTNIKSMNRFLQAIQEIVLSTHPVRTEFRLKKEPRFVFSLSQIYAPLGPTGEVERVHITENPKIPKKVEYIVNDQIKAEEGISRLAKIMSLEHIQKIFSVGLLGLWKKIVPTRYSITAVDDILAKHLIKKIKDCPLINEITLFKNSYLGNRFWIVLLPNYWEFEMIEKWEKYNWISDYEPYEGRKDYAKNVTGGYYAARLAVCEYLAQIKRQASVIVIRIINNYSSLGVWVIRETVRGGLNKKPIKFDSLEELSHHIPKIKSKIILNIKSQRKVSDFS